MKKLLFLTAALFLSLLSYGQEAELDETLDETGKITWTSFKNNWFITAGIGIEDKVITQPVEGFDLDPVATYDLAVGKWISPFIGVQFKYNYSALKGYSELPNIFVDSDNNITGSLHTIHIDIMADIFAIISGYKADRFYRLVPYIGAGASIPVGQGTYYTKDYITAGIINSFRINEAMAMKFTIKTSISNIGHYGHQTDATQRNRVYPLTASIGYIYKFKPRGYKLPDTKEVVSYVDRVVYEKDPAMQQQIEELTAANAAIDTVKLAESIKELVFAGSVVNFELNSSEVSKTSVINLGYVAQAIKMMPSDQVFTVVGYCDVQTGSTEYNAKLSKRRAEAVYDILVNFYGVDKKRLKIEYKGGVETMFLDDSTLSRAVIMQ